MKQLLMSEIASAGAFVQKNKNVLIGRYNSYYVVVSKVKSSIYEIDINADRGSCRMDVLMDYLYSEIAISKDILSCNYENSTVRISVKAKKEPAKFVKELLDKITLKFSQLGISSGCGFCSANGEHNAYKVKGNVKILCNGCYEKYYEFIYGKKLKKQKKDRNLILLSGADSFNKGLKKNSNIVSLPMNANKVEYALEDKKNNEDKTETIQKNEKTDNIRPFRLPATSSVSTISSIRSTQLATQTNLPAIKQETTVIQPPIVASKKKEIALLKKEDTVAKRKKLVSDKTNGTLALKEEKDEVEIIETVPKQDINNITKISSNKSVLTGILGTIAGAMAGIFIWVLAYELQTKFNGFEAVTEFAALVMPLLMMIGYSKFTDKITNKGIIAVNIAIIVTMFLAFNFTVAINISDLERAAGGKVGILGAFGLIPKVLSKSDASRIVYIKALVGSYILAAVVDAFTIYIVKNKIEQD